MLRDPRLPRRIWDKVTVGPTGCWLWTGAIASHGYGRSRSPFTKKVDYVHRIAFQAFIGELTPGLVLDHLCRDRACLNPEHLEEVTHAENLHRGAMARTHCPSGHEWNDENTKWYRGYRTCRPCGRGLRKPGVQRGWRNVDTLTLAVTA